MWIRTQNDEFIEMTGYTIFKCVNKPNKIKRARDMQDFLEGGDLVAEYNTEYECDLVLSIFQQALFTGVPIFSFERKVTTELIKKYAEKYDVDLSELGLE